MTYAEVTQFGNSEQIHFLESADPVVADGQLLIEIQSAGINFSDIMARLDVYPDIPRPPFRPGFEVAGRINKLPPGLDFDRAAGLMVQGLTAYLLLKEAAVGKD